MSDGKKFAVLCFEYQTIDDDISGAAAVEATTVAFEEGRTAFNARMAELGFNDFRGIGFDYYDSSIEFYNVGNDVRLSEAVQNALIEDGFYKAFVNHQDGWETHYTWTDDKPVKGWRRRWVEDPTAQTTRVFNAEVDPSNAGYYEISYWPSGWGDEKTENQNGYFRIVPDPMGESP